MIQPHTLQHEISAYIYIDIDFQNIEFCFLIFWDNDKRVELMKLFFIYFILMISFEFEAWEFYCDKNKLLNLKDRSIWINLWSLFFSIYLQLCH